MRTIRLFLAKLLWPKEVSVGDHFTITAHLDEHNGKKNQDTSWFSDIIRADRIEGDTIYCSLFDPHFGWEPMKYWRAVPGVNCTVKLVKVNNDPVKPYVNVKEGYAVI